MATPVSTWFEPSAFMITMDGDDDPAFTCCRMKAIRVPSGDHAGAESYGPFVNAVWPEPSALMISMTLDTVAPADRRVNAICRPFGDSVGCQSCGPDVSSRKPWPSESTIPIETLPPASRTPTTIFEPGDFVI